ncbi:AAA family ATPase [Kibdelosporangium philippinense]|uniref:AAA family ATPase n=1 Tax=Kibdelosporangium philippinense TaxID=211113 RepID=A0ABS8ZNS3_9PSEU|nr:AAA family ATPase [Kibdelosporangium philippinense]MCE7009409.1 AAA family ATPase [Kibdelosporangium philippinense]
MIKEILAAPPRLGGVRLVAIDGPSGSGKSTFARELVAQLPNATLISTDDFATWEDPVAWWSRLAVGVLDRLAAGRSGGYRVVEWTGGVPRLGAMRTVHVPEFLVIEGVSAGRSSVRPLLSALIWCEVPDQAERLERAVSRDGETSRSHLTKWQLFEQGWFAVDATRECADHVVVTALGNL